MNAGTGFSHALRQVPLERRLAILIRELDMPESSCMLLRERSQTADDTVPIAAPQQTLGMQHLDMGDGAFNIVGDEPLIERMVFFCCVAQYTLIEPRAFVPQSAHHAPREPAAAVCCSACVRAFTSATISVPVPSLVNTSPRMPSGDL